MAPKGKEASAEYNSTASGGVQRESARARLILRAYPLRIRGALRNALCVLVRDAMFTRVLGRFCLRPRTTSSREEQLHDERLKTADGSPRGEHPGRVVAIQQ